MNKKGQFGIITLVAILLVLLFLAPVLLKIVRTSVGGFATALNNTNSEAASVVEETYTTFINLWDYVIIAVFGISVVMLFLSAFFIDTHPAFVILYIFVSFLVMAFTTSMVDIVNKLWDHSQFAVETGVYLTMTEFLKNHFAGVILGIMVLSGIIIYAKIRYFSNDYQ